MNIACPHCKTVFRVDPQKIPAAGVRTRCSVCRGVFEVLPSPAAAAPPPPPPPPPAPSAAPAAPSAAPAPAAFRPPAPPPTAGRPPHLPPQPLPESGGQAPLAPFRFGSADPGAKARRLARALVSDIITYHPERREEALRAGSLKTEFRAEIRKSWEEYVGQVGVEAAQSTSHFRDALNDILAKDQPLF